MKALKITLSALVIAALLSSCTKQDLNENDILQNDESVTVLDTGQNPDK